MKNILILTMFLFVALFSFVGCSEDDPVSDITGPSNLDTLASDIGLSDDRHFDLNPKGFIQACLAGYHLHADAPAGDVCRNDAGYDVNNMDTQGCLFPMYHDPDPDNDIQTQDGNCVDPS